MLYTAMFNSSVSLLSLLELINFNPCLSQAAPWLIYNKNKRDTFTQCFFPVTFWLSHIFFSLSLLLFLNSLCSLLQIKTQQNSITKVLAMKWMVSDLCQVEDLSLYMQYLAPSTKYPWNHLDFGFHEQKGRSRELASVYSSRKKYPSFLNSFTKID